MTLIPAFSAFFRRSLLFSAAPQTASFRGAGPSREDAPERRATMWRGLARSLRALPTAPGDLSYTRVPIAGLKNFVIPQNYDNISIPEKPKLKFIDKVPSVPKVRREFKNLRDIRGPSTEATEFTEGQYGILALGGGYLHWGHFEMMRLTVNRHLDPKIMFAIWRVPAPYKPITRKSLGHRMGGGKGAIDHYVTAVKCGRLILEVGGRCEFGEVEHFLTQVAKKLPFPAKAVSRQSLEEIRQAEEKRRRNNQNSWTFERIITSNMLGIRKVLSPYDLAQKGRYWGKFFLQDRV